VAVEKHSHQPILVSLSNAAARIDCADAVLRERYSALLRHCADTVLAPQVRFSVSQTPEGHRRLEREEWTLYEGEDIDYMSHLLFHELLTSLIRNCTDSLVLHSGAVARGGSGLLLCGESASGKSTLSAWLTAAGFDYLTDELAVVALDGRSLTGFPRAIMLRRGSAFVLDHWLDEEGRRSCVRFSDNNIAVDPETLRPASVRDRVQPKAICFPRYSPGEPLSGRRLSSAEATLRLIQVSTNAARLPGGGVPAAMALARGAEAFILDYPDAASAAAWIESRVVD